MKEFKTIIAVAEQAKKEGLTVYLSKDKAHGFFTDGNYCVSFENPLHTGQISLSTNHKPNRLYGTGFCINENMAVKYRDYKPVTGAMRNYLECNKNAKITPVTEKEHLATYGACCGFTKF